MVLITVWLTLTMGCTAPHYSYHRCYAHYTARIHHHSPETRRADRFPLSRVARRVPRNIARRIVDGVVVMVVDGVVAPQDLIPNEALVKL